MLGSLGGNSRKKAIVYVLTLCITECIFFFPSNGPIFLAAYNYDHGMTVLHVSSRVGPAV